MSRTNLVSIVGAGHSGSTLLDLILGAHSEIWSIGEIINWDLYLEQDKVCSCASPIDQCEFWSDIVTEWHNYLAAADNVISTTDTRSNSVKGIVNKARHRLCLFLTVLFPMFKYGRLLTRISPNFEQRIQNNIKLLDLIRKASNRPVLCDSSKSIYRFRLLHSQNPERAKAIFLTRDGRAFAASHFKRVGVSVPKSARSWLFINVYTQLMLRTLPKNSYIHIRYEELCRDPETALKRICDFIDLPYDVNMLKFSRETQHNIGGNRMRMKGVNEIKEDLKWRDILSEKQLKQFDWIAGKTNTKLLGQYKLSN